MTGWGATHVLAYEQDGKMVEVLVRRDGSALYTVEEWTGGAVPDWTFEDDGRLYWCGEDFVDTRGKASLRPVGKGRLRLDAVLALVVGGVGNPAEIAEILGRSVEEIETALATLERLGDVTLERLGVEALVARMANEPANG